MDEKLFNEMHDHAVFALKPDKNKVNNSICVSFTKEYSAKDMKDFIHKLCGEENEKGKNENKQQ